ncbi:nuclease [Sulfitobacter phage phiGT1]|nr:nuclease [Sulfitobacter phage phiGT1]
MGIRGQYKNKRDANEPEIFDTLRGHGFIVCPLDKPCDAVVGYGGRSYLVEVKMPKGKLTGPQQTFLDGWRGDYTVLRTVEDATAFARAVRAGL